MFDYRLRLLCVCHSLIQVRQQFAAELNPRNDSIYLCRTLCYTARQSIRQTRPIVLPDVHHRQNTASAPDNLFPSNLMRRKFAADTKDKCYQALPGELSPAPPPSLYGTSVPILATDPMQMRQTSKRHTTLVRNADTSRVGQREVNENCISRARFDRIIISPDQTDSVTAVDCRRAMNEHITTSKLYV